MLTRTLYECLFLDGFHGMPGSYRVSIYIETGPHAYAADNWVWGLYERIDDADHYEMVRAPKR